jgi:hypothetical protein
MESKNALWTLPCLSVCLSVALSEVNGCGMENRSSIPVKHRVQIASGAHPTPIHGLNDLGTIEALSIHPVTAQSAR